MHPLSNVSFTASPYYDAKADCLSFYAFDCKSYRERIDDIVTLYRSVETDGLVGCQIKGIRNNLLDKQDVCGVVVSDQELTLQFIFTMLIAFNPAIQDIGDSFRDLISGCPPDQPVLQAA